MIDALDVIQTKCMRQNKIEINDSIKFEWSFNLKEKNIK